MEGDAEGDILPPENDENAAHPDTRARPDGLIPQLHGGAIHRGWDSTSAFRAQQQSTSMKRVKKQIREMMTEKAEEVMKEVIEMATQRDDRRVAIVAAKEFNDRFHGKVTDLGILRDEEGNVVDLSKLTSCERLEVMQCLTRISEITGASVGRIEGDGE